MVYGDLFVDVWIYGMKGFGGGMGVFGGVELVVEF